jgi:hypothetical protein
MARINSPEYGLETCLCIVYGSETLCGGLKRGAFACFLTNKSAMFTILDV